MYLFVLHAAGEGKGKPGPYPWHAGDQTKASLNNADDQTKASLWHISKGRGITYGRVLLFYVLYCCGGNNDYNPTNIQFIPCFLLYPIGRRKV